MNFRSVIRHIGFSNRTGIFWILVFWFLGIIVGMCLSSVYAYKANGVVRFMVSESASPICTLLVTVIPVVLIAFSLLYASFVLRIAVIVTEAVCYGFCSMLINLTFVNGAWLIRFLLLFSSICASALAWWLIFRHRSAERRDFIKDVVFCLILSVVVSVVDILFISPFLNDLCMYI